MKGREGESFMHHRSGIRRNKLLRCQSSSKSTKRMVQLSGNIQGNVQKFTSWGSVGRRKVKLSYNEEKRQ